MTTQEIHFLKHIKAELIDYSEGFAVLAFDIEDLHKQHLGMVHGGAIATLADNAGWYAVRSLLSSEQSSVTIELKVNFLKPVAGEMLRAEARVVNRTKRTAFTVIELFCKDLLVAYATATFAINEERKLTQSVHSE
ncbi:PaaI family thioesterase [Wolinella succinogenes]|jgi:uncharacterized protein (TIGR00369 family)|uniref:Thioesterase domain-containing protein n=1 Tax=Wolinella succinogenes (strain ATCC 29543 / DSM 1740 / CCUG 13145 / JCM 31913 / LMG 7466 / NCTC 11488 / FDC 602W) TaxID=273121 RepID=Q7MS67_WOLSU|nr:hotdog fold thioesterase [Wolinella succinogenes]NLU34889.1 PaaI family thioesterase [Wolinella succinogenes]CAE09841.1 hypothetical protein WS0716 [Wolinella succinogenes]VEG82052.1 Uncharacterized protein, possibly involved in aromatic compounds catabolism [Wolinella succinogenes]HCZ19458.1 PaaI family thioesterase [Helicobacter sp.]